jgi:DNA-binding NarL/FixJ family response regulator
LPDKQWQQHSVHQQLWAGTGAVRFIVAGHRRPGQAGVQVLILGRTEAEKPFSSHDLAVLKFFNTEQHKLHAEAAKPLLPADLPVDVTRRQREVLGVLLEGCGVKETAKRLNISPRTVEDHIKALYQLFGVHSRSALMARFIR